MLPPYVAQAAQHSDEEARRCASAVRRLRSPCAERAFARRLPASCLTTARRRAGSSDCCGGAANSCDMVRRAAPVPPATRSPPRRRSARGRRRPARRAPRPTSSPCSPRRRSRNSRRSAAPAGDATTHCKTIQAFSLIDQNHDGFITKEDLTEMLNSLGLASGRQPCPLRRSLLLIDSNNLLSRLLARGGGA